MTERDASSGALRRRDGADPEIVIVGAGMSGIAMAITLKRAGLDSFVVLEQSRGVGGTWWDNSYPGAQCDVPSHLYSFSFELKPDWTRAFAPSAEIQAYVEHCVRRYAIGPHIELATTVTSAAFDERAGRWQLKTSTGRSYRPRHFVLSLGPLNHPRLPPGVEAFRGTVMHTARWDHAYDFGGKRVAVIGSAASAVQVVPPLAARAAKLTVFQRSPSWIVARPDHPFGALAKRLFRNRLIARAYRGWLYWRFEANFAAFKGRGPMYRLLTHMARTHLEKQVADPALRAKLRPDYPMGCKRILVASDFYPALTRPNVELVAQAAAGFTASGVTGADGRHHEVDAIVCATGFETLDPLAKLPIAGRGGRTLAAAWREGPEAYHGVTVAGFPNLFLLLGPNTGTGHISVLIPIEAQARYTLACIRETERRRAQSLEVRAEVMARHNVELQRRMAATVWASPACSSWYKNASGKVFAAYPGYITRYVLELRRPRFDDYDFEQGPASAPGRAALAGEDAR
ncbi:MAG TPA: NAD(P)/FAD-dependent oxidoreductase [Steroidobacteraceae bacterium]|nr:NAD(P)/FAD-dependent oxidoreductase [Steroidobacteraceae bacterium]